MPFGGHMTMSGVGVFPAGVDSVGAAGEETKWKMEDEKTILFSDNGVHIRLTQIFTT